MKTLILIVVLATPLLQGSLHGTSDGPADAGMWMCVGSHGPNPCRYDLNDVHLMSAAHYGGDGYAVGDEGVILRWRAPSWRRETSPTQVDLRAVSARRDWTMSITDPWVNYGWAVGDEVILRLADDHWSVGFEVPGTRFHDVETIDRSLAFVVGETEDPGGHAVLYQLLEGELSPMAIPEARRLYGVDLIDESDGWSVGEGTEGESVILRWDGHVWRSVDHPPVSGLRAVTALSWYGAWAAGGTSVLRWDGYVWRIEAESEAWDLIDLDMCAANDGFAVNRIGDHLIWQEGHFHEWLGDKPFLGVDCGRSRTWFVGDAGIMALWSGRDSYHGGWYELHEPQATDLRDVAAASASEAWAIGTHEESSAILQLEVGQTSRIETPAGAQLHAIAAAGPDDAVAVGAAGALLQWDGRVWHDVEPITGASLRAVDIGPDGYAWAAGDGGALLERVVREWRATDGPSVESWLDVSVLSAADAWAVGSNGAIARWDGDTWTVSRAASAGQPDLRSVDAVAGDEAWAAGDDGTLLRWDGHSWRAHDAGVEADILGLSMVDATHGWAVTSGDSGILSWDGQEWLPAPASTARRDGLLAIDATETAQWIVGGAAALRYFERLEPRLFVPIAGT